MPEEHLFFVYGTLRLGDDNDITRLQPAPRFIAQARLRGTMYHFGGYPGVVMGQAGGSAGNTPGEVAGEVYAVSPALEIKLNAIEAEYPEQSDAYAKREVDVVIEGSLQRCYVYEINPAYVVGKPVIASGDWVKDRGAHA